VDVEIVSLPREVLAPALEVDHLYRLRNGQEERLVHLEFQTHYKLDLPDRLVRYSMLLHLKYRLPVACVLVLLAERNAPAVVPDSHQFESGGLTMRLDYRVVRLWEIDGGPVLAMDKDRILPLVPLLNVSDEQLGRAVERVARSEDEACVSEFLLLGGLRYDGDRLRELLETAFMNILTPELIEESSFYWLVRDLAVKNITAEVRAEITAKVTAKAHITGARRALRRVLKVRFPGLERASELGKINDLDRLESLIEVAAGETDRAKMESALRAV